MAGNLNNTVALCEVKTLHKSDETVAESKEDGVHNIENSLSIGFLNKLNNTIEKAKQPIKSYQNERYNGLNGLLAIAYIIPCFDEGDSEFNTLYYAPIEKYLGSRAISEVEIVFHIEKSIFGGEITMLNATVINEN